MSKVQQLPELPMGFALICTLPGFEAYKGYAISVHGIVIGCRSRGKGFSESWKAKKPELTNTGYDRISMYKDNSKTSKHASVHRLVALAFISNPENKPQVNHIDGNKQNNRADNLEWVTGSENLLHAYRVGTASPPRGENHGYSKLTEVIVRYIRDNKEMSTKELQKKFGVTQSTIDSIKRGATWQHIT